MRRLDPSYTCVGRTLKTVGEALEAYVASTVTFDVDEAFQPNPRGLKGLFELSAAIPPKTSVRVPYEAEYELGGEGQPGHEKAAIRVAEILSLRRLFYEGTQLDNCAPARPSRPSRPCARQHAHPPVEPALSSPPSQHTAAPAPMPAPTCKCV